MAEFLRYHGVWAPGVRLFRNLGFAGKAGAISTVFLLSVVVLAWNYFTATNAQIESVRKEREGVAVLADFIPVLHGVLTARICTRAMLGGFDTSVRYSAARDETDKALEKLQRKLAARGDPLALSDAVAKVKTAWDASASAKNGVGTDGNTVFVPIAAALVELFNQVGDNSELVLDPDLDSFYIVNALVLILPRTIEDLGQVWSWGTVASVRGGLGSAEQAKWHVWSSQILSGAEDTRSAVKHALAANASLGASLDLSALDQALELRQRGQAVVFAAAGAPAKAYFAQGEAAMTALTDMYGNMLAVLSKLLAARESRLVHARTVTVLALACSLFFATYFFLSFQQVLEGGIRAVARHIDAIREGDLTTQPKAWGRDEVATLIGSLAQMQSSLRRIVAQVRMASENVLVSSTEISSGATDLSARTEESAASLQQSAAAMDEISATVQRTASHARDASTLSLANVAIAGRSGQIIGSMVSTMQSIHASSKQINDIIATMDGIAFQTNILALNAAVEAARAGDSGRGFAVVAAEVRALAQRTSGSAREIKQLITTSVGQVNSGTNIVDQVGKTVSEISATTHQVHQILAQIATAAEEEALSVIQTTRLVQEMDTVTQQNAAMVEQTAAASLAMKEQARTLATEVGQFRLPEPT